MQLFLMMSFGLLQCLQRFNASAGRSRSKKVATVDNLQRRGFQMANMCVLCCKAAESIDHIFLQCGFSCKIWNMVSSALSIYGPYISDVVGFITAWKGMNCSFGCRLVSKVIMHAVFWLPVGLQSNHACSLLVDMEGEE
ncbi:hypothetical protein LINGRAHAP2_LOCUS31056 [Linum grandiflorum]